ncbi:MAG: Rieske 2Fe-2S domain-containing protein [bacterium]
MSGQTMSSTQATCFDLGPLDRIPLGEGRTFRVGDREVAVFRTRSGVFATDGVCSHRDGRLADGLVGDGRVICPLHGFKFELGTGQPIGHDCAALGTYRTALTSDQRVELFIDGDRSASWSAES